MVCLYHFRTKNYVQNAQRIWIGSHFSKLMMNGSIVLASILTSLLIQSNAKLDQTEWQFWDDENVEDILRKNNDFNKISQA